MYSHACRYDHPTDGAKQVQTTIAHDEAATVLDPDLGLRLEGHVWPFLLIAYHSASTLSRHRTILPGAEDEKIEQIVQTPTLILARR